MVRVFLEYSESGIGVAAVGGAEERLRTAGGLWARGVAWTGGSWEVRWDG